MLRRAGRRVATDPAGLAEVQFRNLVISTAGDITARTSCRASTSGLVTVTL
jgi:hypothetical protein